MKNNGRVVLVGFFTGEQSGLDPKLRLAADAFADLTELFLPPLQQAARVAEKAAKKSAN